MHNNIIKNDIFKKMTISQKFCWDVNNMFIVAVVFF